MPSTRSSRARARHEPRHESERPRSDRHGWRQEGRDLLRAIAAGCIVGVPLLYTMEMWWAGMTFTPVELLCLLALILAVNVLFCLMSGFRRHYTALGALVDGVSSVGIAAVLSLLILALIGEVTLDTGWFDLVGKVLLETLPTSIGITFANAHFLRQGGQREGEGDAGARPEIERRDTPSGQVVGSTARAAKRGASGGLPRAGRPEGKDALERQLLADLRDAAATLVGATVFAFNTAPTEEILLIAQRLSPERLLVLLGAEVALCYIVLFASGLRRAEHAFVPDSVFQSAWAETAMTTALSLSVAAALILLLGFQSDQDAPRVIVAMIVTLGLPAVVGGAAGRLIV